MMNNFFWFGKKNNQLELVIFVRDVVVDDDDVFGKNKILYLQIIPDKIMIIFVKPWSLTLGQTKQKKTFNSFSFLAKTSKREIR